jgi:hypothetical protein
MMVNRAHFEHPLPLVLNETTWMITDKTSTTNTPPMSASKISALVNIATYFRKI